MNLRSVFTTSRTPNPPSKESLTERPAQEQAGSSVTEPHDVVIDIGSSAQPAVASAASRPSPAAPTKTWGMVKHLATGVGFYRQADAALRNIEWTPVMLGALLVTGASAGMHVREALPQLIRGETTAASVAIGLRTATSLSAAVAVDWLPVGIESLTHLSPAATEPALALISRATQAWAVGPMHMLPAGAMLGMDALRRSYVPKEFEKTTRGLMVAEVGIHLMLRELTWNLNFNFHRKAEPAIVRDGSAEACNGSTELCALPLGNYMVPATHNAYATPTRLNPKRLPGLGELARLYVSNQEHSIKWQLEQGFRGFSLEYSNDRHGEAFLSHNHWFNYGKLSDTLGEFTHFLQENPRELVVLQILNNDYVEWSSFVAAMTKSGLSNFSNVPAEYVDGTSIFNYADSRSLLPVKLGDLINNGVRALLVDSVTQYQSDYSATRLAGMNCVPTQEGYSTVGATFNLFSWPMKWFSDVVNAQLPEKLAECEAQVGDNVPLLVMVNHGATAPIQAIQDANLARARRLASMNAPAPAPVPSSKQPTASPTKGLVGGYCEMDLSLNDASAVDLRAATEWSAAEAKAYNALNLDYLAALSIPSPFIVEHDKAAGHCDGSSYPSDMTTLSNYPVRFTPSDWPVTATYTVPVLQQAPAPQALAPQAPVPFSLIQRG
jgi:hypothetical protein